MILPLCLVVIILLGVALASAVAFRVKRLTSKSCSALIQGMRYVDMAEICAIARDAALEANGDHRSEEFLIERLGGVDGLMRIHHNAGAMMDIARYLILMKPEAYELAQDIRQEAMKVRRIAKLLCWRQRWGLVRIGLPFSLAVFARRYVSISVSSMTLCSSLVEEVLPLLQEASNVQARMGQILTLPG